MCVSICEFGVMCVYMCFTGRYVRVYVRLVCVYCVCTCISYICLRVGVCIRVRIIMR